MFRKLENLFSEELDDCRIAKNLTKSKQAPSFHGGVPSTNSSSYSEVLDSSEKLADEVEAGSVVLYPKVLSEGVSFRNPLGRRSTFDSSSALEEAKGATKSYQDESQTNSQTENIELQMAQLLRQQQNISESYQKLAAAFQEQGNTDRAAEYYRQAIMTKSKQAPSFYGGVPSTKSPIGTSNITSNNAQKSTSSDVNSPSIVNCVSDNAFSFVPLLKPISRLTDNPEKNLSHTTVSDGVASPNSFPSPDDNVKVSKDTNIAWETIQLYAEQALDGYDNCQWQVTVEACKKILRLVPDMAEAHKILGNALQRMGDTGKAMDCYAKALRIQPDLAIVYGGIGKLYYQQQKWLKAKEYYQKATIINPLYAEAYLNLAYVWQQLDQPEKAEFCQKRAASIKKESSSDSLSALSPKKMLPTSAQGAEAILTYYKLAQNLEQNQKWQEAALHYRKAVELNNIYLNCGNQNQLTGASNNFLSLTSTRQSQLERAIEHYANQAKLKPSSAKIQFDLGNLYAKNQQLEQAVASYEQAIKIEPANGRAYINLGKALAELGRQTESIEQLYLGYTIQPELADADNLFNLGKSLVASGDHKRAINCYSFAINLNPSFILAYHSLAETLMELDRKPEAVECYQKAIQNNPQDTYSHFALGEEYTANRQWDNAVEAYRRVLELQPKYPQAAYRLSHALSQKLKSNQS